MHLTIQVQTPAALALHQREPPTAATQELLQTLAELNVVLTPMHPGIDDPILSTYFTIEVPDTDTAERVKARLLNCKAIAAVYLKPPDAMP
jgi:hypothetical protein